MANSKATKESKQKKLELEKFLADISKKIVDSDGNYVHSMLALNSILSQPELEEILDDNLKQQAKDIWIKIKSAGVELVDPPILFGLSEIKEEEISEIDGGDEVVAPISSAS